MYILGLSAFYHDSAAALVKDGLAIAAAQEERFTRKRHDASFPKNAVEYCLAEAGIKFKDVDYVAFFDKPFRKFERLLATYIAFVPRGFSSFRVAIPLWLREKLFQKRTLRNELESFCPDYDWNERLLFSEHHLSHAASAFFPSPFDEAVVLTLDGVGEWATTSVALGSGNKLEVVRELHFPHSVGLLYAAMTYYLGFKVNSGEYKVMGLAPYGAPIYASKLLGAVVDLKEDGSLRLDQRYFDYCTGFTMTSGRFDALFGGPPRKPGDDLTQRHMDLAASVQAVIEEIILRLTRSLAREGHSRNLCLAGGVALNCVANSKVLRDGAFERVWIQPASGDAGGALGAALAAAHVHKGAPRMVVSSDGMCGAFLGPRYGQGEIEARLTSIGARFEVVGDDALYDRTVAALVDEKAVGWFQGRMEFGPRALGNRSILADARSPNMQRTLNQRVKCRESFRPFASSILSERAGEWFELDGNSPYMLLVADVVKKHRRQTKVEQQALAGIDRLNVPRSDIPAATHVDYSSRVQTVHRDTNPRYHRLIETFERKTGCPVLVNTSFNVRGEPIACTPEDAFRCFMGADIEVLVVGNCWIAKEEQDSSLVQDDKRRFEPD